ncbi:hypothetical protein AURDEDRAFT_128138 [Auricularia subglabra TFB-10046 SS5]|nr:hypothetical protein AURDEDRAFT_128138 [Auricularia subglabra TFB-10046 SS5]
MSGILFDAILTLIWPVVLPVKRDGDPHLYVYSSTIDRDGCRVPVHIAFRVPDPDNTPLLPHGIDAQVFGAAQVVDKTFFVDAQSIWPHDGVDEDTSSRRARVSWSLAERSERTDATWPVLVFVGAVSSANLSVSQDVVVVDVTVARKRGWADGPATFRLIASRCRFDRTAAHLRNLESLDVETVVHISGTLSGIVDGRLAVDVHDACFRLGEYPCTGHGIARGLGVSADVAGHLCKWRVPLPLQYLLDGDSAAGNEIHRKLALVDVLRVIKAACRAGLKYNTSIVPHSAASPSMVVHVHGVFRLSKRRVAVNGYARYRAITLSRRGKAVRYEVWVSGERHVGDEALVVLSGTFRVDAPRRTIVIHCATLSPIIFESRPFTWLTMTGEVVWCGGDEKRGKFKLSARGCLFGDAFVDTFRCRVRSMEVASEIGKLNPNERVHVTAEPVRWKGCKLALDVVDMIRL